MPMFFRWHDFIPKPILGRQSTTTHHPTWPTQRPLHQRRTRGIPSPRKSSKRTPPTCQTQPRRNQRQRLTKHRKSKSEFYDPCQEAAQRSYKCLYRNGGDKSMCGEYFQFVFSPGKCDSRVADGSQSVQRLQGCLGTYFRCSWTNRCDAIEYTPNELGLALTFGRLSDERRNGVAFSS